MSHVILSGSLAATVANNGTLNITYPSREAPDAGFYNEGDFHLATGHQLIVNGTPLAFPQQFDVSIDGVDITLTNRSGSAWPAGSAWVLEMQQPGKAVYRDGATGARVNRTFRSDDFLVHLGAPDTAVAAGICASQAVNSGVAALLNGTVGAVLDVPRNVVAAWTNAAIITVTGLDEYGRVMVERSASGTSFTGRKAFKQITSVTFSANVTGATVGTGDVLGLPVFLPHVGCVVRELQDAAVAVAGTTVVGALVAGGHLATSGDVRGTYDPAANCNGEINFSLIMTLPDPGYLGQPQFAG